MATEKNLKWVYMGTPAFAAGVLEILLKHGFKPEAVVTPPDKPAGRGLKLKAPDVKIKAQEYGIPVWQYENLTDPALVEKLQQLNPDIIVVVAFKKLPGVIWKIPRIGTINLHASLLPQYRGAAPINWVIINGEKKTGVTTFFINDNIDTGDILMQEEVFISPGMTAGQLHDVLMNKGGLLLVETLKAIEKNTIKPKPQITFDETLKKAPKIYTRDCVIDWKNGLLPAYRKILGLSPYPGSIFYLKNINRQKPLLIKAYHAEFDENKKTTDLTWNKQEKEYFEISSPEGTLKIDELQPEGKRKMTAKEFLNGIQTGEWELFI